MPEDQVSLTSVSDVLQSLSDADDAVLTAKVYVLVAVATRVHPSRDELRTKLAEIIRAACDAASHAGIDPLKLTKDIHMGNV